MKQLIHIAATAVLSAAAFTALHSCEDAPSTGTSLVEDQVDIVIDSTFSITGKSVANDSVLARTVLQMFGSLSASGYGTFSSDVVCQYMPSAEIDTLCVLPEYIDSVKLTLSMLAGAFAGDSTIPMGLTVYPLTKGLTTPIGSSFNPEGYYDPSNPIASITYSAMLQGATLTTDDYSSLYKEIEITLPTEMGVEWFNEYKSNPSTYLTPQAFTAYFPGLYIKNTFGTGRVTRINSDVINVYYHSIHPIDDEDNPRDTTLYHVGTYMGVTPEIITNNNISFTISPEIADPSKFEQPMLVGPIGYDVEITIPAREIIERYQSQAGKLAIINTMSMSIPVTEYTNDYGITPPPYVLLVKKSEKEAFFADMKLPDNVTSFYTSYDTSTQSYDFSSMRSFITTLMAQDEITDEDEEYVICPVLAGFTTSYSSSSYYSSYLYSYYYGYYGSSSTTETLSSITPYVTEPVMATLNLDEAQIKFTFSKQQL